MCLLQNWNVLCSQIATSFVDYIIFLLVWDQFTTFTKFQEEAAFSSHSVPQRQRQSKNMLEAVLNFVQFLQKLDGVGPVDNRPSTD